MKKVINQFNNNCGVQLKIEIYCITGYNSIFSFYCAFVLYTHIIYFAIYRYTYNEKTIKALTNIQSTCP